MPDTAMSGSEGQRQDQGASVPDQAGRATPRAAGASRPSGDHPSREALLALAERCEAASGPDHGLDREISQRLGLTWLSIHRVEHYTVSLDAAMTLVPEGWAIEAMTFWPAAPEEAHNAGPAQSRVTLAGLSLDRWGRRMLWGHGGKDGRVEASALTPALALTAAALRVRAAIAQTPADTDSWMGVDDAC